MKSLVNFIKENINEGAGAGYEVTLEGLSIESLKLSKKNEKVGNDEIRRFSAKLKKVVLDKWSADGYYEGVNSKDGIGWNGELVVDYGNEDKTVDGGTINGYCYLADILDAELTDEDIKDHIEGMLKDFTISTMVGSGYSHVYLKNPMKFQNVEVEDSNGCAIKVEEISVIAPKIVEDINWFFENNYKFDEIFGEED